MCRRIIYFIFSLLFFPYFLSGQQSPFYPLSYRVFSPAVFNPAITGSHEFPLLTFTSGITHFNNNQLLNGDLRIQKRTADFSGFDNVHYSRFGIGGFLFHNDYNSTRKIGGALSASYHLPLDDKNLSFLSFGMSVRGMSSKNTSNPSDADTTKHGVFYNDLDVGIYYYSPFMDVGLSVTNIFSDTSFGFFPSQLENIVSRQYILNAGYKFVISKRNELVLEPMLIINYGKSSDTTISSSYFHPGLKLYYKESFIGWYLNDPRNLSFFMHLQLPRFFVGTYIEFPLNPDITWQHRKLIIEITAGINIGKNKTTFFKYW